MWRIRVCQVKLLGSAPETKKMYFLIQHIAAWNSLLEDLVKIKLKNNTTSQNQECKYLWGKKYTNENLKPNPNQNNETCSYYLRVWSIFSIVLCGCQQSQQPGKHSAQVPRSDTLNTRHSACWTRTISGLTSWTMLAVLFAQ